MLLTARSVPAGRFFFEGYGDHRDLHSFPTRRSSDLRHADGGAAILVPAAKVHDARLKLASLGLPKGSRSEEHTSELQSPVHLVCRLLLEKKKLPRRSPPVTTTHAWTLSR